MSRHPSPMSRNARDAGKLRPLNRPRPVRVSVDETGAPARLLSGNGKRWSEVETVLDRWRLDDEWWREPISRVYYALVLEGGAHAVLYHDLVEDRWYRQAE